jgi:cathepsin B
VAGGAQPPLPRAAGRRALPSDFDSATAFPKCAKTIGDIRDQSNCGCCWAFGSAEAASDRLCTQTNGTVILPLSAQDLCFCPKSNGYNDANGCGGGYPMDAWGYIVSHGLVTGSQQQPDDGKTDPFAGKGYCSSFSLPHCHHHGPTGSDPYPAEGAKGCASQRSAKCPTKCDASAKAPHNDFAADKVKVSKTATYSSANAIAQALMDAGPVTASFTVYDDFENYAGGIYKPTSHSSVGGHAVKYVGFGTDPKTGTEYWKLANSWNPYWGENGYFRIVRGSNACGIESGAVGSSATAKWTVPTPCDSPDRYHCADGKCVLSCSGHSTMDKCTAACSA